MPAPRCVGPLTRGAIGSFRRALPLAVIGVVGSMILALPGLAYPRPGTTQRESIGENGSQGNFDALSPAISGDGRIVVFESISNTLVTGDSNARSDVFIQDRDTRALAIVSLAPDGSPADGRSHSPAISADGRFVAFESLAANLVPGDTNGTWDVFVRDLVAQTTERVSVSSDGSQHDAAHASFNETSASLSADGRFVAFTSAASNLVADDLNGVKDVFAHDRQTGTTERVSVSQEGVEGDAHSGNGRFAISAEGRYVAFHSQASTLAVGVPDLLHQVYRKDRVTGEIELISVTNDGVPGNQDSLSESISGDGSVVVFDSFSDNLVPTSGPGLNHVFLRDLGSATTQRVSLTSSGQEPNDSSESGLISADGRFVSFSSWATNLSEGKDGRWPDVFVYDRVTGETQQASLTSNGQSIPLGGRAGVLNEDGSVLAFQSAAGGYSPGDTNDRGDIFTRERGPLVGIVDGPRASVGQNKIEVDGSAVFSGVVVSTADDPADDGGATAAASGTELVGADIAYRPEAEDLAVTLRAHRVEGPAGPDSQLNVYGISLEIDGTRFETRSSREGEDPHGRHLLFSCEPVCTELAPLQGSIGEAGDEVRISVPLELLGAQETDGLTSIRAFSGRGGGPSGSLSAQDEVALPDGAIPATEVEVGLVPRGTPPSEVAYQVVADVHDGGFVAELPRTGWAPGDYDLWAKGCLDETCGANSAPLTLDEMGTSPSADPTFSASPTPSASSSPSPRPSSTPSPNPSPSSSFDPLCPPGQRCERWATQYKRASEGVGYPRGMAMSPDDSRVYLMGDYGPTFFERNLHTLALDATTGEHLWVSEYNGPMNESETAWAGAASRDLVFSGGESMGDSGWQDLVVVAYDAASGAQRWEIRKRGAFNGINQAKVMTVSPDERVLYVSGRMTLNGQSGDFATFALDAATGEQLWFSSYNGTLADYDDPQGITLSADGSRLFVTGHSWGRHSSFDYATIAYDASTGRQLWVARYDTDFEREFAAGVVASPDGERVYVTGSGITGGSSGSEDYATVAYNADTGEQLWAKLYDAGLADRAFDIAMDPRGELVVVTGISGAEDTGDDMATIAYDAGTGEERWVRRFNGGALETQDWGTAIQISPRGNYTFVTGTTSDDALTFAYDTRTGATAWEAFYDGPANQTDDPFNLVMSSDGSWVYPGGLMMHSENFGFSSLAQYFAVGYQTGISEVPDAQPSPDPTVSESPSATPTESPTADPTTDPTGSPTSDPTTDPPPSGGGGPGGGGGGGGQSSPGPTDSSSAPVTSRTVGATTTTLTASRALITHKETVALAGVVERDPSCSGPLEVELLRRDHGTTTYESIGSTPVNAAETWTHQIAAMRNASYVAQVMDTTTCRGEASQGVDVLVRVRISVRAPASCRGIVRGRISPDQPGSDVVLQRRVRRNWKQVGTDVLDGRSRFRLRVRSCGLYRVEWPEQGVENERGHRRLHL